MNIALGLSTQEASLRAKIKAYKKVAREIQDYLASHPDEWGKFQSDFNIELNGIFRDIMNFEKNSLSRGDEESVYKLKRIFVNHLRQDFLYGESTVWSLKKPYGYAGDFKIIDDIYRNNPETTGFERLFDNYAQMSAIAVAIRNRKEDLKKFILSCVREYRARPMRIMNLAAGPCRDVKEMLSSQTAAMEGIFFDCYDQDEKAIQYGKILLGPSISHVNFYQENVLKLALKKNIESEIHERYRLIYASGLFDYLDKRIAARLVGNLRKLLAPEGRLIIANVREKYQNPSVHFLEWVGDWNLIYRSEEEFKRIFLDAGFDPDDLQVASEQQGIIQYVLASQKG